MSVSLTPAGSRIGQTVVLGVDMWRDTEAVGTLQEAVVRVKHRKTVSHGAIPEVGADIRYVPNEMTQSWTAAKAPLCCHFSRSDHTTRNDSAELMPPRDHQSS